MKTPFETASVGNEFSHQVALFQWCNMVVQFGITAANDPLSYSVRLRALTVARDHNDKIPELGWLFAVKNAGHGDAIRGARAAAEGVKSGVPDMCLPVPIRGDCTVLGAKSYHGLYIELKRPGSPRAESRGKKGVISKEQIKWREYLQNAGYAVEVCYGWEPARDCLLKYLGR